MNQPPEPTPAQPIPPERDEPLPESVEPAVVNPSAVPSAGDDLPTTPTRPEPAPEPAAQEPEFTRISALWVAVGVVLVVAILLLIFILQNLQRVRIHYLGLSPSLPLGVALLIAAVAGAVVVAVSGTLRVLQLRRAAKKNAST